MNSAVIVSGGSGTRFGGDVPKQFIKINGQEILAFSVTTFLSHPQIDEVIIVSHKDWVEHVISQYPQCHVVVGGKRRQDSCLNGVLAASEQSINILIHDAARPFITPRVISDCLEALNKCEGSAPIMNTSNSIIQLNNDKVIYVDRSKIREVQTPQCFKKKLILDVLSSKLDGTDEIGMILRKFPNAKLKFVDGDINNKKINSKMDLYLFRVLPN